MIRNIKLTLAYDGTEYSGWQIQKNARSVQEELERVLAVLNGKETRLTGSGRTDSGVHARGQIANFYTDRDNISVERFTAALNAMLPADIRVIKTEEADQDFHSRFDAKVRIYRYYINPSEVCEPWHQRYCWRLGRKPDLEKLNGIVSCLQGTHDFTAFAAAGDPSKSMTRTIYSAAFSYESPFFVFKIAGNAFLWRMVRSIVGTAVELERNGLGQAGMKEILESCSRERAGATAPARGLFLERVSYEERTVI